jgi:hypothetical protein
MKRIGITGHQRLPKLEEWIWVKAELILALSDFPQPVVGISSLAIGADQLFAEEVLNEGGTLETIIPFQSYPSTFHHNQKAKFQHLRDMSSRVEVLPPAESDEKSYLLAGKRVVDLCDSLIAVWNGEPAQGLGGTADVVQYAFTKKKPVVHINPANRTVTQK